MIRYIIVTILVFASAFLTTVSAQSNLSIEGMVVDASTNSPLPYATLSFRSYNIGTVTNSEGRYTMKIAQELANDTLTISYIGFKNTTLVVNNSNHQLIKLVPDVYQLEELVIRPISAFDYMREVIRKIPENYMDVPFKTLSYYKKRYDENKTPIEFVEAMFSSYQFPYPLLDSSNQHQLVLHSVLDKSQLQFQRKKADKMKAKARKQANKKGEDFDEEASYNPIKINFVGPEGVLKADPVRTQTKFLDSTRLKKYVFEFHETTVYNDMAVEVIKYTSKRKQEQLKSEGLIYVDKASFAIIKITENGRYNLSAPLKALLYTMGYSFNDGIVNREMKYKSFQGKWYPENIQATLNMDIVKHNMFSKNERAHLDLEQVLSTIQIATDEISQVEKNQLYDNNKKMDDQVFPLPDVTWEIMR